MRPAASQAPSDEFHHGPAHLGEVLPDISTPTHVHDLVIAFYREIVFDEVLEPVFGEVAEVDWAEHIPKLIDYWCWILFGTGRPSGAVTSAHRHLQSLAPIQPIHCDRWYQLWSASVDSRWAGPTATKAKDHAATLMTGLAKRVFDFTWERPEGPGGQLGLTVIDDGGAAHVG